MLQIIRHRVNQISELERVSVDWGVEIDLRSQVERGGKLHLSHDPWVQGDDFENWIQVYVSRGFRGPLILNTKEDGLEGRILQILESSGVDDFFFLDTTIPTLSRWALQKGESRFAIRLSKLEPMEGVLPFEGRVKWVWVDCFNAEPLDVRCLEPLHGRFRICLVSPELQQGSLEQIPGFKPLLSFADAVCTKAPEKWLSK